MIQINKDNMTYKVKSKTVNGKYITYVKARTCGLPTQYFTLSQGVWLHVTTDKAPPAEVIDILDSIVIEANQ